MFGLSARKTSLQNFFILAISIGKKQLKSKMSTPAADGGSAAVACNYVRLSKTPLRFHPVDSTTSVFFDEANKQVRVVCRFSKTVFPSENDTIDECQVGVISHRAGLSLTDGRAAG